MSSEYPPPGTPQRPSANDPAGSAGPERAETGVPGIPTGTGEPAPPSQPDARAAAISLGPPTTQPGSTGSAKPPSSSPPSPEEVVEGAMRNRSVDANADPLQAAAAAIDQGVISESPLSDTALPSFTGETPSPPPYGGQGASDAAPGGTPQGGASEGAPWQEVVEQFRELGMRLGSAFRAGWTTGQPDEMAGLRDELRATADRLDAAIRSAREEATRDETREQLRQVTENTLGEVRHATAQGLRVINERLAAVVDRLEGDPKR